MSRKIGRNELCPCGSGKKYKKCCLGRKRPVHSSASTPSRSPESEDDEGFSLYETGYDEELDYNPRAREAIIETVENQLRDNDPPEARQTFERLVREGHSEHEAKELIACLVAGEIFKFMKYEQKFDVKGYVADLERLPELPEELVDDEVEV